MKKVGVISLYHNSLNYGGVLQAYALNHVIMGFGCEVEQINYCPIRTSNSKSVAERYLINHSRLQLAKKGIKRIRKKIYIRFLGKKQKNKIQKRKEVFDSFKEKHVSVSPQCDSSNIAKICGNYDAYICGSDQIWKPTVVDEAYMLSFTKNEQLASSYAASISVDSLTEEESKQYAKWLSHLTNISVREEKAVELLSPLTDKPVKCVCDPTLLITNYDWLRIVSEKKENEIEGPYVFCYFLGDDKLFRQVAQKYAKQRGCKIVSFPDLQQKPLSCDAHFGDYRVYSATPFEFVRMIRDADCVITDSFHATAFSLNLNVPFFVFERSSVVSMSSRITSLLSMVKCEDRFVEKPQRILSDGYKMINWKHVNQAIEERRTASIEYLKACMPLIELEK